MKAIYSITTSFVFAISALSVSATSLGEYQDSISKNLFFTHAHRNDVECFDIQEGFSGSAILNAKAKEIREFSEQVWALYFDKEARRIDFSNSSELSALAQTGRKLQAEFSGKIGHRWVGASLHERLSSDPEYAYWSQHFACTQTLNRAMALVAPQFVDSKKGNSKYVVEYQVPNEAGEMVKKSAQGTKMDATRYAALVVNYWFGEAGIEEFLGGDDATIRVAQLVHYFNEPGFFATVRVLRYHGKNKAYGLTAADRYFQWANDEHKIAIEHDGFDGGQRDVSAEKLEATSGLIFKMKGYYSDQE